MAWWMAAAALAPTVAGAFQKKPKTPSYRAPQLPDRSSYVNQMLESGFDPQSELYRLAQDSAIDRINRGIARQGLVGSSAGLSAQRTGMSDLANRFLMSELDRRKVALGAATNYDQVRAGIAQNAAQANYQSEMAQYQDQVGRQQGLISGIGSAIGAGMGWYGQEQALAEQQANRDMMQQIYGISPYGPQAPSYGPPAPAGPMTSGYQLPASHNYGQMVG